MPRFTGSAKDRERILNELEKGVGIAKCNELVIGLMRDALATQGRAALGRLPEAERRTSQLRKIERKSKEARPARCRVTHYHQYRWQI